MVAVDYEALERSPMCAPRSRPARRSSGRKRRAMSASTGPRPADPDGKKQAALERVFADAAHVARVGWSTSAWSSPRWSRAARPRAMMPAANPSRCAACSQGAAGSATSYAAMGLKPEELRVITEDVGGAFGMKTRAIRNIRAAARRAHARPAGPLDVDALGSLPHRQAGARPF